MSLSLSGVMRVAAAAFVVSLLACSSDGGGATASPPSACAAGTVADASGACVPATCTEEQRVDDTGACKTLGWQACPAGFTADPSGHGCRDVLPAADCAPGTMPVLGQTACQPVGPATCAAGFEKDPSGWGCRAILPTAACTGATKETLGSATCAPVGDCAAAFPPAGATLFVNAAFTAGQVDATHVRTIGAALAVAGANAVIAVEAGTYTESVAPTKSVRIVGRCPAQVTLASDGSNVAGIIAGGAVAVTVEGMTVSGHLGAATVAGAATLTLRDAVLSANRADSVSVTGTGTHAVIERSVIRGSTAVSPGRGLGILANGGADLIVRDSAIADNVDTGILVAASSTHALIDRSVVLSTKSNASGDFGLGVMTRDGATSETTATALVRNHEIGLFSYGKGSHAVVTDVVVEGTLPSPSAGTGPGLSVDTGLLDVERVTVNGSSDVGVHVEHAGTFNAHGLVVRATKPSASGDNGIGVACITGGVANLAASAVVDNQTMGTTAIGPKATLSLDGTLVTGTAPDSAGGRGYGVELELGGVATLTGSAVVGNTESGIYAIDASTKVTLTKSVVSGTKAGQGKVHGRGMVIQTGASGSVTQSAIVGNRDIAVSVRNAGSSLTMDQTVVRGTLPQDSDGTHGRGLEADDSAKLTVSQSSLLDNHGVAILGSSKSAVDVRDSWIAGTLADSSPGGPGRAVTVQANATMTLLGVVVQRSVQIAMVASASASLTVRGSRVEDTVAAPDGTFGHGLLAYDGALMVVDDVAVTKSAGSGLVFAASRGNVNHARISANAVGIHVQDGSMLAEVPSATDDPAEDAVNVSSDSTFDGNGSRVGSGALPLPVPLQ
ncbi:MAG: hypothetical protein JWO86_2653 [Myxococcaceae bacterium]|nr:hypothetical protein [Myxococcaceae bacterium]